MQESEHLKLIFESQTQKISTRGNSKKCTTEKTLKGNIENEEASFEEFKKEAVFFQKMNKEKVFPGLIPTLAETQPKNERILVFEDEMVSFGEHLNKLKTQKKIIGFSQVSMFFKTLLNGFCYLQACGIGTQNLSINDLFVTKKVDLKLLNFKQSDVAGDNMNFIEIILTILNTSKEFALKELETIESLCKTGEIVEKDSFIFKVMAKSIRKSIKNNRIDLFRLFAKTLEERNMETMKKIIIIQDDFKAEKNYDLIAVPKHFLTETFELINPEQKVKIFGLASEQFFHDFKQESEVPQLLATIKPIHSMNICTTRGDPENDKDKSFFSNCFDPSLFPKPFRTVNIQASMGFHLVGNDQWLKFFWKVFYKKGQDIAEVGELKLLHEHETYWDYGVTDQQVEDILSVFKSPVVNSEDLENLKIFLQSWWTMTEDSVVNLTKVVKDLKFKKIRKFEIGLEITGSRNLENRTVLVELLKEIEQSLKGKDEEMECFSFFVYSNFTQDDTIFSLCNIFPGKRNMEKLNLFFSSISSKAPFEQLLNSLEPELLGNLNTLTLGFDSWVLGSSYVEDSILKSIWHKLKQSLSPKIKDFSFFILTLGFVEETLDLMWDTMADYSLDSCNIYFVGYFHHQQKVNSEHFKKKLEASLKKNNHEIDIGAFYFDFWK